ncbi:flagellar protein FlaG [Minwuia sp.]|uniref:flagellar protein FlaG n=1 Tax=Minwuia sp. TaxID=2493630 RepID=UPI003A900D31
MISATGSVPVGTDALKPTVKSGPDEDRQTTRSAQIEQRRAEKASEEAAEPVVDRGAAAETVARAMFTEFPSNATLEIDVNDQKAGFIYKAVDRDTGEVIKQFPAEEVLAQLERLAKVQGLAVDGNV